MSSRNKGRVLVITHDAGGSEIIAGYIRTHAKQYEFLSYVAGPAARIFRREQLPFETIADDLKHIRGVVAKHRDAAFVLLGTGWMTKIESRALAEAKKCGLKGVVYLESWVNYRERFGYPKSKWRKNLPDEIWVGDEYALHLARRCFAPHTRIRLVPNQYFVNVKRRFNAYGRNAPRPDALLFLNDTVPEARVLFSDLLSVLSCEKDRSLYVLLRFHPADNRSRYDKIIKRYRGQVRVEKSHENDIVRDLLRARLVIGTETVAMVPAALVGKKTINIVPSWKTSMLPFPQIIRMENIMEALRLI
jgi:hypothetical protein